MGLFQHKQQPDDHQSDDSAADKAEHFFDEVFREELRNHGRWYFEKIITENAALFKQDLDDAINTVKAELKERMTQQLDQQMVEFAGAMKAAEESALQLLSKNAQSLGEQHQELSQSLRKNVADQEALLLKAIKDAQDLALQSISSSAQALEQQRQQLTDALQKNIAHQESALAGASEENRARITAMKAAQDHAMQSLNETAQAIEQQRQQLAQALQENVARQQEVIVQAFEQNTAQIIEHYLLGALGDQYDFKAQLPLIIKQMEENKQAIVDDMKL